MCVDDLFPLGFFLCKCSRVFFLCKLIGALLHFFHCGTRGTATDSFQAVTRQNPRQRKKGRLQMGCAASVDSVAPKQCGVVDNGAAPACVAVGSNSDVASIYEGSATTVANSAARSAVSCADAFSERFAPSPPAAVPEARVWLLIAPAEGNSSALVSPGASMSTFGGAPPPTPSDATARDFLASLAAAAAESLSCSRGRPRSQGSSRSTGTRSNSLTISLVASLNSPGVLGGSGNTERALASWRTDTMSHPDTESPKALPPVPASPGTSTPSLGSLAVGPGSAHGRTQAAPLASPRRGAPSDRSLVGSFRATFVSTNSTVDLA